MKKLIQITFCSFLLSHVSVQAQVCDAAAVMSVKGKWTNDPDNIVSRESISGSKLKHNLILMH